ncbi:MAG: ribulose-phosphate 3-epimerase [Clostridium sp.]|uniref:ribulose-phosphate 3-epimerase n=1 Tax=Clostridium sp. TaxID=1506 RepID=UPI0029148590|nr:ribulose-phosphate 3-epimerase [Clostridium sp.]MDU4937011.1 ribulose-phosphate 3-epimerase [Clostridium sp.]
MKRILCASMMCANFGNLENEVKELEEGGIDIFHLDVMDGNFVPNFGMGLQDIEYICKQTNKTVDVHLMVTNPSDYVEKFAKIGCDIIYIHPETDMHAARTLQKIIDSGAKAGIAINPGTSFESVKYLLTLVDYVLIMSVNPGFAGQKYLDFVSSKFHKFIEEAKNYGNYKVMIDGACTPERVRSLSEIGVSGFILGTSALFGKDKSYKELIEDLRK